jgi:hypothetical protein
MARYEWIIVELLVLAWLIWGLVSTRLSVRRDRRKAAEQEAAKE